MLDMQWQVIPYAGGALFEKASLPDLEDGRGGRSENHSLWYMSGAHVQWRTVFFFFFARLAGPGKS